MLTRTGYLRPVDSELKKTLTVRALPSGDFPAPAPFKVYREKGDRMSVPRYFPVEPVQRDTRPEPHRANIHTSAGPQSDIQREAIQKGIRALDTVGGGVLSLPCGFGKTFCAITLAAHFKVRTMVVVHKEFLATQWEEQIKRFCPGTTVGRVQCDRLELNNDVVIALIQTMSQRTYPLGTFDSIGLLIVDEAHHVCARAFSQFLFKLCPKYTLGLTATPERKDGLTRLLYWFLGPSFLCVERTGQDAEVRVVEYHGPFPEVATTRFGKLSLPTMITDLSECRERNEQLCTLIDELLNTTTRNILLLTDRRCHAHFFIERYPHDAGLYIGGLTDEHRETSSLKRLIIATFGLAQEGLDIPKLDTVILATPKSDIKQAVGRILRGGSINPPLVYDVVDHWCVFYAMAQKRKKMYREMQFVLPGEEVGPPRVCLL